MSEKDKGFFVIFRANKIQDLIHTSSRLKEVAGGSWLLEKFCQDAPIELRTKLGLDPESCKIVTSSGGNISIYFQDQDTAKLYTRYLQEIYRRIIGGHLLTSLDSEQSTVSKQMTTEQAYAAIRMAKWSGHPPETIIGNPYMATCWSCGQNHAEARKKIDETYRFYCQHCLQKSDAFASFKKTFENQECIEKLPNDIDDIAKIDSRGYIAYMVSDGNNMGAFFTKVQREGGSEKIRSVSKHLPIIIKDALCNVVEDTTSNDGYFSDFHNFSPFFPLITGGDDCFVVWPAPCGFSMSMAFMKLFGNAMEKEYDSDVTMSVGLVISKQTLSHKQAHTIGENLLSLAKRRSKEENKEATIAITVVKGSLYDNSYDLQGLPVMTLDEGQRLLETRRRLQNLSGSVRHTLLELIERYGSGFQKRPEFKHIGEHLGNEDNNDTEWNAIQELLEENGVSHDKHEGHILLKQLLLCWDFLHNHNEKTDRER